MSDKATKKKWYLRLQEFDISVAELVSTVLIGLATLLSAWCGYQSAKWATINDDHDTHGLAALQRSVEYAIVGNQKAALDAAFFTQFLDAYTSGDKRLANFLFDRFPENLKQATTAWLKSKPLENPQAARTPFVTKDYRVPDRSRSDEAAHVAEEHSRLGDVATKHANAFLFASVLFTMVLFLASIATKMRAKILESSLLILSLVFLVLSFVRMLTLPLA